MAFKRYNTQTAQWEAIAVGPPGPTGATGPIGPSGYVGSVGSLSYTTVTDYFTGNGSQTTFTLSTTPRDIRNTTVNINGALQFKNSYSLNNSNLTFSEAPPINSTIEITTQVFGPAYTPYVTRTYTGDGTTANYTVSGGTTVDSTIVSLNGVIQAPTADYTISGTTITFTTPPTNGVSVIVRELPGALQGETGYTGSTGDVGYTGSIGYTGSASTVVGYTGSQGLAGGVSFEVTNNGSTDWVVNGTTNPTLTLARGYTYYFNINATGYPLYIKTTANIDTLDGYNSGVTNNADDVGVITFVVPFDAPTSLYYVSPNGSNMVGNIIILDAGFGYTGSSGYTGSIGGVGYTGSTGGITTGKSIAMAIVFGG